jgi:transcriptional regulator with XRE-family HTH domain
VSTRKGRLPGIDVEPSAVRQARLDAGLSMAQLAGRDFTRQTVFLIEAGKARPSRRTLDIIAERTRRPARHFLKVNGHRPSSPEEARQEFYDLLCAAVEAWEAERQAAAELADQLGQALTSAFALKQAMERMGVRS